MDETEEVESSEEPEKEDESVDVTLENLDEPDSYFELGTIASHYLQKVGSCSFIVDEQGAVRVANPFRVFFGHEVANPPEGVEPVFVRPIITNGRPTYVAEREDGSLWEVEYQAAEEEVEDHGEP